MSNDMDYKVILTAQEVERLKELVEVMEAKLEYERLALKAFRSEHKVKNGDEMMAPDLGYVADVIKVENQLDYYKVLLANYELANPQTDGVEIGSYVSVYDRSLKKEFSFLVVQEKRVPGNSIGGIKIVTPEAPLFKVIENKKYKDEITFTNPNTNEESVVMITEINNEFCKQFGVQKTMS